MSASIFRKQPSDDGFEKVRTDDIEISFNPLGGNVDYESRVREIYMQYNRSKLDDIPRLLEKYRGQEENLILQLERKYITEKKLKNPVSYDFIRGALVMITDGPLNILLVATPLAFISSLAGWPDLITFIFALLSIAPFAERLGFVTEQLALHTSDTIGGLLNATFGNATELIISIAALYKGLYRVVQLSLLGSIVSNLLLVLGCAFLFGGMKYKTQYFDKITSQINSTLLMLAATAILVPTTMTYAGQIDHLGELGISRFTSLILFSTYCAYLYFQVSMHINLYTKFD
jgi:Ca2+/Na+ antiporter